MTPPSDAPTTDPTTTAPRVRFCPAPSGWLHVGGARTALFNWLWAKGQGGTFVLRIEDTDAQRATMESAEGMMQALQWLGLDWDEGPPIGQHAERGAHGPYLQSQRRELHDAVVSLLVASGHAYGAFDTTEELQAARDAGDGHVYRGQALSDAQREALLAEGRQPVIRVSTPTTGEVSWPDAVRGQVQFDWADIGDFVIARADGSPTYMLANTTDDLAQGVGFVARGEDLLSTTPRQILLTDLLVPTGILDQALAQVTYPARPEGGPDRLSYAHLPLLVGEDRKKLSKRHGDVAIEAFRDAGILPEVMLNFMALCGWSYDGSHERFSVQELIDKFSFDRVQPSPAYFDTDKLRSLNGDAIKELSDADLASRLLPAFQRAGVLGPQPTKAQIGLITAFAPLLKDRIQTLAEAVPLVDFAFAETVEFDPKAVAKWLKPAAGPVLDHVTPRLAALSDWNASSIMQVFTDTVEDLGIGMGKAMQPVRVIVTGSAVSPPLPETLAVLDQDWVIQRVRSGRSQVQAGD
ncbi:MAG: glutamate--tRNA ligase [Euzebya sp.]